MEGDGMAAVADVGSQEGPRLRPVARWVQEPDGEGRSRLVMVWSVPDPDSALRRLAAVQA